MDASELWCWRSLLRVPWTARRSNQSIQDILYQIKVMLVFASEKARNEGTIVDVDEYIKSFD